MQDPQGEYFPLHNAKSPGTTLHILGRGDTIVSMGMPRCYEGDTDNTNDYLLDRGQSLIDKFEDPLVEVHDGGEYASRARNI